MRKIFKIALLIIAMSVVVTISAKASSDTDNYYKPGKKDCYGVAVESRMVCTDLVTDAGNHAGCKLKGFRNSAHALTRYCFIKKSIIPKRPSDLRELKFKEYIQNFYNEHSSKIESVIKVGEQPAGNYKSGDTKCFSFSLADQNECQRLFLDAAIQLKCLSKGTVLNSRTQLAIYMQSGSACISKTMGIQRSGPSAFAKVMRDFYDSHSTSASNNELVEITHSLDGHHRSKGYSNILGKTIACPAIQIIETNLNVKSAGRSWDAIDLRNAVQSAYRWILSRSSKGPANKCLKKPINFIVKADGNQVYNGTYDQYRTARKEFMEEMALVVIDAVVDLQSGGGSSDIFAFMQNSQFMRAISKQTLNYKAMPLRDQVSIKQLFFIYHNKFYKKCIVPAKASKDLQLRKQAILAGFFGKVFTTVKKFYSSTGRLKSEKTYEKLDVQPEYVEQYVNLSNFFHKSSLPLLTQGYSIGSTQGRLATDVDVLLKKLNCFGDDLNRFEASLSNYANRPLKTITNQDIIDGFVKK